MHRYYSIRRLYRVLFAVMIVLPRWWMRVLCAYCIHIVINRAKVAYAQLTAEETCRALEAQRDTERITVLEAIGSIQQLPLATTATQYPRPFPDQTANAARSG